MINPLVTVTFRGLGRALVDEIAAGGGFVIGVARTAVPVATADRVLVQGDLTEPETVRALSDAITDRSSP